MEEVLDEKQKIYYDALFDRELFNEMYTDIFGYNYEYQDICEFPEYVEKYIEFNAKFNLILLDKNIKNFQDIKKYFNDNGPTEETKKIFYDALFDKDLFLEIYYSILLLGTSERYKDYVNYEPYIDYYIKYNTEGVLIDKYIKTPEDIKKYFNNNGPTEELKKVYDDALFDRDLFNILFQNDNYKDICNYPDNINEYIKFNKALYGALSKKHIKTPEDIKKYFNDNGPTEKIKEVYDDALFDKDLFNLYIAEKTSDISTPPILGNNIYSNTLNINHNNYCKYPKYIEKYIEFNKEHNGILCNEYIKIEEDIKKYFSDNGPKEEIKKIFDNGLCNATTFNDLFNNNLFNIHNYKEICKYPKYIEEYINFNKNNNSILCGKIIKSKDEIKKYFDDNGPTINLYTEGLYNEKLYEVLYNSFSYLHNDKIISEYPQYIKNFIEFNNKIYSVFKITPITSLNDINELFEDDGPTDKMLNYILENKDVLKKFIEKSNYNLRNSIQLYLNYSKYCSLPFIESVDNINEYFSDTGPKKEFYDKALYNRRLFTICFSDEKYESICNYTDYIKDYIKLNKKVYGKLCEKYVSSPSDITTYFTNSGPKKELYDKALYDKEIFTLCFSDEKYKSICNYPEYIENYIKFNKKIYGKLCEKYIKSEEDIKNNFVENSPKKELQQAFREALFKPDLDFFKDDYYKEFCNCPKYIENYIDFITKIDNYFNQNYKKTIKSEEDIKELFNNDGPTNNMLDYILKDEWIFRNIIEKGNYKYPNHIQYYIEFEKKGYHFETIKSTKDIASYFDEKGPKKHLCDKALFDEKLFKLCFSDEKYESINYYPDFVKNYINLNRNTKGALYRKYVSSPSDITTYFSDSGPKKELYDKALFDVEIFNECFSNEKYIIECNYPKNVENYIKVSKRGYFREINEFIKSPADIDKYFDEKGKGPNREFLSKIYEMHSTSTIANIIEKNLDVLQRIMNKNELITFVEYKGKFKYNLYEFILNKTDNGKRKIEYYKENQTRELIKLLDKIEYSNSIEIRKQGSSFASLLLEDTNDNDDVEKKFEKIENTFLRNDIPYFFKVFNTFKTVYPNYQRLIHYSTSPMLQNVDDLKRNKIILKDLLMCVSGSNNKDLKLYLDKINKGNDLYLKIIKGEKNITSLSQEDKEILNQFVSIFNQLQYLNSDIARNLLDDEFLKKTENESYLKDKFISILTDQTFTSLEELQTYIKTKVKNADEKNRKIELQKEFNLEPGDFVRGIGDIKHFEEILNIGSVSREFLGSELGSDATPLDTDFSVILNNKNDENNSIGDFIDKTITRGYGPIWLVIKKNNPEMIITRRSDAEENQNTDAFDESKFEMFYTGAIGKEHYGLRTGFPSTMIDYFVVDNWDYRLGYYIAMNGFYIPVVDRKGNVLFTSDEYDAIRKKMMGLSYYEMDEYRLSKFVENQESLNMKKELKNNEFETNAKREALYSLLQKAIMDFSSEYGTEMKLKTHVDNDIKNGSIIVLDTGSTGRKTNVPGDGDFDLMMEIDQNLLLDDKKLTKLKTKILQTIDPTGNHSLVNGDIRDFKAKIPVNGELKEIKIDISFIVKTNKNGANYPTEECVKDRLKNIEKQYPDKYDLVLSNILLAKKLLKGIKAYEPNRKNSNQGGLGGVGVENWILQNGGSLTEAIKSFMEIANSSQSFADFKNKYFIVDFGYNHMAEKKNMLPHDNFIENMNSTGYEKMKKAFEIYLRLVIENNLNPVETTLSNYENEKNVFKNNYSDEKELIDDIKYILGIQDDSKINKNNLSSGYMYEYIDDENKKWLLKPSVTKREGKVKPARAEIQAIASNLQKYLNLSTYVPIYLLGEGNLKITAQPKYDTVACNNIIGEYPNELLGEYVIDYLIGNYDAAEDNFIVNSKGQLKGIDKEQGLKYLMMDGDNPKSLDLRFNYIPDNSKGTIYNDLFDRYIKGDIELDFNYLLSLIQKIKEISDEDYKKIFEGYIYFYNPENPEKTLNEILNRKKYLEENINEFINHLTNERNLNQQSSLKQRKTN